MKRNKLLALVVGVCLILALVAVLFVPGCAPEVKEAKTLKIGYLVPFSGPAAMWGGLTGITYLKIWVEEVNAAGGVKVGNKSYPLEIIKYDTENMASKALVGARKLIYDDKVDFLLQMQGPPIYAVQPLATKHKLITMATSPMDTGPERPWLFGIAENFPMYHAISMKYIADTYPEKKRVALVAVDDITGRESIAWSEAACIAEGFEITYNKLFATDTTDFAPIISAVMATNPDIINTGATWPEFKALLCEQAYLQGFKGIMMSSEWELANIFAKVPEEFMEGGIAHIAELSDPNLPPWCTEIYNKWMARYGPGAPEDVHREFYSIDWEWHTCPNIWKTAVEKVGTLDPDTVREEIYAMSGEVPFPTGPGTWWGEEVFGINNGLLTPQYLTEIRGGRNVNVAVMDIVSWWEENREVTLECMEKYHMLYWQR